ncbi:MAG: type III pantothenate kinase [Thiolinea sp.]
MSSLLIDAGNSRLKWALLEAGVRPPQQALAYAGLAPVVAALQHLRSLLQAHPQVRRVVLVHVLGEDFTQDVQALCEAGDCELVLARSVTSLHGLQIAYPNPAHLGADRFVGLLAARQLAPGQAAILMDAGTAVTVDAVQADGTHLGGLILPGLQLLGDALVRRTQASHMSAALLDDPQIFTNNTLQGMGSGCLFALVGALEGICERMQERLPEAQVILCGGDAELLHAHVRFPHRLVADALMDGLHYLAEHA